MWSTLIFIVLVFLCIVVVFLTSLLFGNKSSSYDADEATYNVAIFTSYIGSVTLWLSLYTLHIVMAFLMAVCVIVAFFKFLSLEPPYKKQEPGKFGVDEWREIHSMLIPGLNFIIFMLIRRMIH